MRQCAAETGSFGTAAVGGSSYNDPLPFFKVRGYSNMFSRCPTQRRLRRVGTGRCAGDDGAPDAWFGWRQVFELTRVAAEGVCSAVLAGTTSAALHAAAGKRRDTGELTCAVTFVGAHGVEVRLPAGPAPLFGTEDWQPKCTLYADSALMAD